VKLANEVVHFYTTDYKAAAASQTDWRGPRSLNTEVYAKTLSSCQKSQHH